MIAHPGTTSFIHEYPHPETGETIRGYRTRTLTIWYTDTKGRMVPFTPVAPEAKEDPDVYQARLLAQEGAFRMRAKTEGLRVMPRTERRVRWLSERRRQKKIIRARKRQEQ